MNSSTLIRTSRIPTSVHLARALLAVVAISHLVVAIVLWADEGALRAQIASQHPEFGAAELARSADIAVVSGAVFHGVLLLLCVLLAAKLATGQPWTRRLTTISQLVSILFSAFSWSSSPMFHAVIPIIGVIQIIIVALLWAPRSAREFFARSASSRTAR
jgi:hypothetical protein